MALALGARCAGRSRCRPPSGYTLTELPGALEAGAVRALWIQGEDLIDAAPNQERMEQALERAEFLVVQEMFLHADRRNSPMCPPDAVSGYEKDGTYTNLERRVQRVRKAIPPVAGSKPDWQIFIDLARRFGYDLPYRHPSQIMDEIATMVPDYAGITYRRIDKDGMHWPVPAADHPGTPTLHLDGFATPSGKAQFVPTRYVLPGEAADDAVPAGPADRHVRSTTGTPASGPAARSGPQKLEPDPIAGDQSAADAELAGVRDGDLVQVDLAARRGVAARASHRHAARRDGAAGWPLAASAVRAARQRGVRAERPGRRNSSTPPCGSDAPRRRTDRGSCGR